jgi:YfiH family protein
MEKGLKSFKHDGLHYFSFEGLPQNGAVRHAVFSRRGGVSAAPFDSLNMSLSVPDDRDRVYANRRKAYGLFGRDTDTVVHAHLVHGATVARVTQAHNGTWVEHVDGLITDQPGCVLSMNFADCTPIFLYDPRRQAIGLGHAGWRGTVAGLPGAMVRAMSTEFGSDPADLVAAVGPCIGPCCYEVGSLVIDAVREAFAQPEELLPDVPKAGQRPHDRSNGRRSVSGNRYFDMREANRRDLAKAGVSSIEMSEYCTACRTDMFFSHRAEKGRTGRFGTVFALL